MTTPDEQISFVANQVRHKVRWIVFFSAVTLTSAWFAYISFVPRPSFAEIHLPQQAGEIPLDHFDWMEPTNPRRIATVKACFTRNTWIRTMVYAVEDGALILIADKLTGRSSKSSRPTDPYLMTFPVTFALADAKLDDGHTTLLTMRGATRSTGNLGGIHQRFGSVKSEIFTGRISPGETRLLYIEGDRSFMATPTEEIEDFAANNKMGKFLVVTIGFDR